MLDDPLTPPTLPTRTEHTARELRLVSEYFHQINRVLPISQKLLTLPPDMTAREAVEKLISHGFSQAPVVERGAVLGVFSFRSFAKRSARDDLQTLRQQKGAPGDIPVDECLEQFEYARVTAEMQQVFGAMERDNGVLIGSPELLQGILTPMDFLRYLHQVASPFVTMSEIELTLRALMRIALRNEDLSAHVQRCLGHMFVDPDRMPKTLEEMTFDNYRMVITHSEGWPIFAPLLGPSRSRVGAKLKEVGDLRNDLFHFKRLLTQDDRDVLVEHRSWLLMQARKVELRATELGGGV